MNAHFLLQAFIVPNLCTLICIAVCLLLLLLCWYWSVKYFDDLSFIEFLRFYCCLPRDLVTRALSQFLKTLLPKTYVSITFSPLLIFNNSLLLFPKMLDDLQWRLIVLLLCCNCFSKLDKTCKSILCCWFLFSACASLTLLRVPKPNPQNNEV